MNTARPHPATTAEMRAKVRAHIQRVTDLPWTLETTHGDGTAFVYTFNSGTRYLQIATGPNDAPHTLASLWTLSYVADVMDRPVNLLVGYAPSVIINAALAVVRVHGITR